MPKYVLRVPTRRVSAIFSSSVRRALRATALRRLSRLRRHSHLVTVRRARLSSPLQCARIRDQIRLSVLSNLV